MVVTKIIYGKILEYLINNFNYSILTLHHTVFKIIYAYNSI